MRLKEAENSSKVRIFPLFIRFGDFDLGFEFLWVFFYWVYLGLSIVVVKMGFMADCKVTDLGEFDASPVMVRDDRMGWKS